MFDKRETVLVIDDDVHAVLEFMQKNIPAGRLVAVAAGISSLAPILWGEYQPESIRAFQLVHQLIWAHDQHTQSASNE
jgi:hypothetical protein